MTVAELLTGVAEMPFGARRDLTALRTAVVLESMFDGRAVAFDVTSARHYAAVVERRRRAEGSRPGVADGQVAAICSQYGATLATRNVRHFRSCGIELVNPWEYGVTM